METYLRNHWGTKPTQDIADFLGLKYRQVESKAYTLGLSRSAKPTLVTHPMPTLTDPEWAYLAGLIDGEGTITIVNKKVKGKNYPQPKVNVTNTCPKMRDWLAVRGFNYVLRESNAGCWYFTIYIPQILLEDVLRKIEPWLITKRHLATLVLRWLELRKTLPFRYTPLPEMLSIHEQIRSWNMQGSEKYGNAPQN